MKSFDQTYADHEFEKQLEHAKRDWMASIPRAVDPDLDVEGLSGSIFARLLASLTGRR